MKTITIRVNDDLEARLKVLTAQTGSSQSEIVREALKRHLSIKQFQDLRKNVIPFAEAQGYLTDEDIFKDIS